MFALASTGSQDPPPECFESESRLSSNSSTVRFRAFSIDKFACRIYLAARTEVQLSVRNFQQKAPEESWWLFAKDTMPAIEIPELRVIFQLRLSVLQNFIHPPRRCPMPGHMPPGFDRHGHPVSSVDFFDDTRLFPGKCPVVCRYLNRFARP